MPLKVPDVRLPQFSVPVWSRRLGWQTMAVALVACGMIHICATLVVPHFAQANAFHRLSQGLPLNVMRVLPATEPGAQALPFLGADERIAICHYDVSQGPVEVSATLPERGWTLGFYTASGDNFYVVPAQDLRRFELAVTLVPATERFLGIFSLGTQADTTASQVSVPQLSGYVVLRGSARGRAYGGEMEATLQRAVCQPKRQ
jgi:uncharacterized membrane protein